MAETKRRHWIPPAALGAGQLAHAVSWVLLFLLATRRPFVLGLPALLGGQFKLYQPRALQNVPARA
jgi:hypothetical protein